MPEYRVRVNYTVLVEAPDINSACGRALIAPSRGEAPCNVVARLIEKKNQYPKGWIGPPLRLDDVDNNQEDTKDIKE